MADKTKDPMEKLLEKQRQIQAQIQKLEAARKDQERKNDTRRKILIGSYFLEKADKENKRDELFRSLDKFLIRNDDRKLFDLPIKETAPESKQPPTQAE